MYEIAPCKIFLAQTIWTRNKECRRNQAEWISQNSSFTKLFGMVYHDLPYQHETLLFLITYIWSQFLYFLFVWGQTKTCDQLIKEKMANFQCYPKTLSSFLWRQYLYFGHWHLHILNMYFLLFSCFQQEIK